MAVFVQIDTASQGANGNKRSFNFNLCFLEAKGRQPNVLYHFLFEFVGSSKASVNLGIFFPKKCAHLGKCHPGFTVYSLIGIFSSLLVEPLFRSRGMNTVTVRKTLVQFTMLCTGIV